MIDKGDKGFRVVGGHAANEDAPVLDARTEEEKLKNFFDNIMRMQPRCVTVLIEAVSEKGLSFHEMRTFPDVDVAEIGNVYLAYRALQAIIGSVVNSAGG